MLKRGIKAVGYLFQGLALAFIYPIFRFILPFKIGSEIGGWIAEKLGPLFRVNKIARKNIRLAFPNKSLQEIDTIIQKMWNNLGRTLTEYARLPDLDLKGPKSPVEVSGEEHLCLLMQGNPCLIFLGHLANWEYATLVPLKRGAKIAQVYRTLNNPWIARLADYVHGRVNPLRLSKGSEGARQAIQFLKKGIAISMLVDQKMNEGLPIPFFGYPAMTAPGLARLALKFQCPIFPVQVERLQGVRCRVTYHPPLIPLQEGTSDQKVMYLMRQVNEYLEKWIYQNPGQWMWLHNRWPADAFSLSSKNNPLLRK